MLKKQFNWQNYSAMTEWILLVLLGILVASSLLSYLLRYVEKWIG